MHLLNIGMGNPELAKWDSVKARRTKHVHVLNE